MTTMTQQAEHEVRLAPEDLIVSKTDLKGKLTYVNRTFLSVSGFTEGELLGQPHSIVRHPSMPRGVLKLLWGRVPSGRELFAYVKNRTADGNYYWVLAHVTASTDPTGAVVGYHSSRRAPCPGAVEIIEDVYARMRLAESGHANTRLAAEAGFDELARIVGERGATYDEFVWSLANEKLTR